MSFEDAAAKIKAAGADLQKTLSNEKQLEIYSLFKQGTVGDCNIAEPSALQLEAKAKWTAWNGQKGMSQDDAKAKYIEIAEEVLE